jgi:hypothetical protein
MPNIDNDYVHALYNERIIPLSSSSLKKLYSQETISTFLKWNKMIRGKSILGIYSNPLHDNSVQLFHQFARKWIFGNGNKSLIALAHICDVNSIVAEELNRPDLKATWQVIKMLYANDCSLINSSKSSRSVTKGHPLSDSLSSHRHHQSKRKLKSIEKQQQENRLHDELTGEKRVKSQEQRILSSSKLGKKDLSSSIQ